MSARMNGYGSERDIRPASEQMVDLHVYLVPADIWRDKYNNALNQNINDTVSLGFIRVYPETKVYALRDEVEQQIGTDLLPREYVFLKSVGRSLTRVKSRQEASLKAKNFLPPQAYAPELYLLEANPQLLAASSEGSTRPHTRTSYDYEFAQRQNASQQQMANSSRGQQPGDSRGPGEDYLRALSATPPPIHGDKSGKAGNNESAHKHDEDSGIAGFTPDTHREHEPLDRRKAGEDGADHLKAASPRQDESSGPVSSGNHDDSHRGNSQVGGDWERQGDKEGEQDTWQGDHLDSQHNTQQDKLMKTNSDEEMARFPSPPPLRLASPDSDTPAARARRRKQREELIKELEDARNERRAAERQREELVRHAKLMQTKTQNRRNHARDLWKKRYFEEKKKTTPLEEQSNRLRHELDIIHKRLLSTLEGPKEKATRLNDLKSSKVGSPGRPLNNFKVRATRLQHEIEDVRRRVDHVKMKLTSEMKLRNQAETELRALRAELTQKKINLTLSRNSHLTTYAPPAADVNFMTARSGITPRS